MVDFYRSLKVGLAISKALRGAKLNHLSSATPISALSCYWAPFIFVGDDVALATGRNWSVTWIGSVIVGLLAMLFLVARLLKRTG